MSLLLPKRLKAEALGRSGANRMNSDDFVSRADVEEQLDTLSTYLFEQQELMGSYELPTPSGWKILVLMLTIPETSSGGVIVVDDAKEARSLASPQGVVIDVGQAAYTDPDRFTVDGVLKPWVELGDRIIFAKYDATLFQLSNGQRLGFLNDTQPIGKIDGGYVLV